jgi:cell division control protein 6
LTQSVFRDEHCLLPDHVPLKTPYRDNELKILNQRFLPMLDDSSISPVAILVGPVGSGKTMITKKVTKFIIERAPLYGTPAKAAYVNCRIDNSPSSVLNRVTDQLSLPFPRRGYEPQETLSFIRQRLLEERMKLLLILDEVNSLVMQGDGDLIYRLVRIGEAWGSSPISVLLVSKDPSFLWWLDESVRSSLQKTMVRLSQYSKDQLYDIVISRAEEALGDNVLDEEAARLIAGFAGEFGDARYAMELLYGSCLAASQSESGRVRSCDVLAARRSMPPHLSLQELEYLGQHERLVLLSVATLLQRTSKTFVSMGELEREYQGRCRSSYVRPHSHTMLWNCVRDMNSMGLLVSTQSGQGHRGRTTLISLSVHPREVVERATLLA